jgi:hypothetical protein
MRVETFIERPRKIQIHRQRRRGFKIPLERELLTFVRTNRRSVQEFGRHRNAEASSADENNAVKKLQ